MGRIDRTVSPSISGSGMGRVTVPMGYADADGRMNVNVKPKLNKKVAPAIVQGALPAMQTRPEYNQLYIDCHAKAAAKFATKGARVIGVEAMKMAQAAIEKIEAAQPAKPAAAARKSKKAVARRSERRRPDATINALSDWETSVGSPPADANVTPDPDELFSELDDDWHETTLDRLEEMRKMSRNPRRQAQEPEPEGDDGWDDGLEVPQRRQRQRPVVEHESEDWLGIPELGPVPCRPNGYVCLDAPEGRLKFRFHWLLKDEVAEQWVIFVQDARYKGIKDVRDVIEALADGVARLQYSDSPESLEDAEVLQVSSIGNCFRMGELVFMQFFLTA